MGATRYFCGTQLQRVDGNLYKLYKYTVGNNAYQTRSYKRDIFLVSPTDTGDQVINYELKNFMWVLAGV